MFNLSITDLAKELEQVPELAPIPAQRDVLVRILTIERGPSKNNPDNPDMLTVTYELPEHPNAYTIRHYLPLPVAEDDAKRRQGKLRKLRSFIRGHGWDFEEALRAIYATDAAGNSVPDQEFFAGSEATVIIALRKDVYEGREVQRNEIEAFQ